MTSLHLFRALRPTGRYPASPLNLSFDGVCYDLILPPRVGNAFVTRIGRRSGGFRRIAALCTPATFEQVRSGPEVLKLPGKLPAYAESEALVERIEQGIPVGYVVQHAAVNAAAAKIILESAISGEFTFDVVDWLFSHAPFLDYSGGFELARVCSYVTDDGRSRALDFAAGRFNDTELDPYRPYVTFVPLSKPPTTRSPRASRDG